MTPYIPDNGDGHQFSKGALGVSYPEWEMRCLTELVDAHHAGRKLSFIVPLGDHEGVNSRG